MLVFYLIYFFFLSFVLASNLPTICQEEEMILCDAGSRCYSIKSDKCDGIPHCLDNSDELNCMSLCKPHQFKCNEATPGGYLCIKQILVCDGEKDCADGSDEQNCTNKNFCGKGEFKCETVNLCIHIFQKCNGFADCPDYSDEKNCEKNNHEDEKMKRVLKSQKIKKKLNKVPENILNQQPLLFLKDDLAVNILNGTEKEIKKTKTKKPKRENERSFDYDYYLDLFFFIRGQSIFIIQNHGKENEVEQKIFSVSDYFLHQSLVSIQFDWINKNLYFLSTSDVKTNESSNSPSMIGFISIHNLLITKRLKMNIFYLTNKFVVSFAIDPRPDHGWIYLLFYERDRAEISKVPMFSEPHSFLFTSKLSYYKPSIIIDLFYNELLLSTGSQVVSFSLTHRTQTSEYIFDNLIFLISNYMDLCVLLDQNSSSVITINKTLIKTTNTPKFLNSYKVKSSEQNKVFQRVPTELTPSSIFPPIFQLIYQLYSHCSNIRNTCYHICLPKLNYKNNINKQFESFQQPSAFYCICPYEGILDRNIFLADGKRCHEDGLLLLSEDLLVQSKNENNSLNATFVQSEKSTCVLCYVFSAVVLALVLFFIVLVYFKNDIFGNKDKEGLIEDNMTQHASTSLSEDEGWFRRIRKKKHNEKVKKKELMKRSENGVLDSHNYNNSSAELNETLASKKTEQTFPLQILKEKVHIFQKNNSNEVQSNSPNLNEEKNQSSKWNNFRRSNTRVHPI